MTIRFTTDNAAFHDHDDDAHDTDETCDDTRAEVARILRSIAAKVDAGHDSGTILDANGNKCGTWSL
jgi:hypothetical protein